MKAAGPVIEHKTYVATRCVRCHDVALQVCIVHDGCEFYHNEKACDKAYRAVHVKMYTALTGLRTLERAEGGALIKFAITILEEAYEQIKARK